MPATLVRAATSCRIAASRSLFAAAGKPCFRKRTTNPLRASGGGFSLTIVSVRTRHVERQDGRDGDSFNPPPPRLPDSHIVRAPFFPSPFRRGASCAAARGEVEGGTLTLVTLTLPTASRRAPSLSRWEREKHRSAQMCECRSPGGGGFCEAGATSLNIQRAFAIDIITLFD